MITRRGLFGVLFMAPFVRRITHRQKWQQLQDALRADRLACHRRAEDIRRRIAEMDRLNREAHRLNREALASLNQLLERGSAQILRILPDA
jgi:hypothetical protein